MRWDNLFDDLEGQLEQELSSEEIDLRAEEERLRLGRMSMRDRVVAIHAAESRHAAYAIRMQLLDGSHLDMRPATVGRDWVSADLVDDSSRQSQCVIPLAAIAALLLTRPQVLQSLATPDSPESERSLSGRLSLSFVLRDLCRRRRSLDVHVLGGVLHGTIDRVGRDHFDLAVHEVGAARRQSAVSQYRVIPFAQLLFVRV